MLKLTILRTWRGFSVGDTIQRPGGVADILIRRGIAELADADDAPPKKQAAKKPTAKKRTAKKRTAKATPKPTKAATKRRRPKPQRRTKR
ncbi:hypothetical protein V7x_28760 [Crateriforma conspicua]|uniref:Uncharacterized protein n=1 Tax=Crateriforma conspicua TaxID=2527996 RepID=A0A5C6FW06_9PLAN|nr:hypothetical protein [Crateriforma conspicua]TWU67302.1 hypothetical protein V7x_28760 [Crateriforma conspicua]